MFSILNISEIIILFLTFIGLIIFLISGKPIIFGLFLYLSLILNIVNRFQLEKRTRISIATALKIQLRKFLEKVNQVKGNVNFSIKEGENIKNPEINMSNLKLSNNNYISALQKDLGILHQSINDIIDYINQNLNQEKIIKLEQKINTFEKQLAQIKQENFQAEKDDFLDNNIFYESDQKLRIEEKPINISWKSLHLISAHKQAVTGLAISEDQQFLVTTSWDQTLKIWSIKDGILIDSVVASSQGLLTVNINQNTLNNVKDYQNFIVTGSLDKNIKVWSLLPDKNNQLMLNLEKTISGHLGSIHGVEIFSNYNILVSGSYDQTVKQWDLQTGKLIQSSDDPSGPIYAIAINETKNFIASGGGDGSVTIWALKTGEILYFLTGNIASIECIAINLTGEIIIVGCADGTIKLWNLKEDFIKEKGEINPYLIISAHDGQIMSLIFHPTKTIVYSAGVDGFIKIWDYTKGEELGHLKITDENRVFSMSLSKDGQILAAGGVNGMVKIWQQS